MNQLITTGMADHSIESEKLETGVKAIPEFMRDTTDRNRTSPFAFTGNKFEFRMVGSRDSIAPANVVLNTIVAQAFKEACDILEKAEDFEVAVHDLMKKNFTEHQRIVFNGNGYSKEWVKEAERRGLPNLTCMVETIDTLTTEKAVKLFEEFGVFTKAELESRREIKYEAYAKAINIEARTMLDVAGKQIIPAVIRYARQLADSINAIVAAGVLDVDVQTELLRETSALLKETKEALDALHTVAEQAWAMEDGKDKAFFYRRQVIPAMEKLRKPVDKLEMIVDKEIWPMPSYGDLLFEV